MELLNENLLDAWLEVTALINNERLVRSLSFNEALICNRLWLRAAEGRPEPSQTELCRETGIHKSLMNRTLNALEEKGLVERVRLEHDKRTARLRLVEENSSLFLEEHRHSLEVVERLVRQMGREQAEQALETLRSISAAAKAVLNSAD